MIHDMQQFVVLALTAVNALLIALSQVALWQRKEYRLDRMKAYLTSPEGALQKQQFVFLGGVFLFLAWISTSETYALMSLGLLFVGHVLRIMKKGIIRPDPTMRAMVVFIVSLVVGLGWLVVMQAISVFDFALFVFFFPVVIALVVWLVGIPAQMQKQSAIARATAYRQHLQHLTVIGITGSVGKTSTKTYLIHLLGGESESVIATSEHRNSPYSVAQDMLSRLSQLTRTYIAEMGAYVPGEIAELADLTQPNIGVVTAITNQHVGLFGSLEALANTKWELIEALPTDGVAVLNKDDKNVFHQARDMKKKVIWFSLEQETDVYARDIVLQDDHIQCDISIAGVAYDVRLPIISKGQLVSVLAAVSAAHALDVDSRSIIDRLTTLPSLPRTMQLATGKQGVRIVDDSYSASEASVLNAIEYLQTSTSSDKRLVLIPIIELGEEGSIVHERIGKYLSVLAAKVYIYGDAYKKDIVRGMGNSPQAHVLWFDDAKKLEAEVVQDMQSDTVILLEGRVPALVRSSLL